MSKQQACDIVAEEMARGIDAETVAKRLTDTSYNQGSTDNISAIVVYFLWNRSGDGFSHTTHSTKPATDNKSSTADGSGQTNTVGS